MLNCLIGLVEIQHCGEPETGKYYINTLAGITLESIDKIADAEQITFQGVWKDVQAQAATRFYKDVIGEITKCYRLNKDCDYDELICDNKLLLINAWMYLLGNQLMIERIYSTRINRFTTVGRDQALELKDFYQVEYEKSLASAVKFMDVSGCELCCGGNPQVVTWLP